MLYIVLIKQLPYPGYRANPQIYTAPETAAAKAAELAGLLGVGCYVVGFESPEAAEAAAAIDQAANG